MASPNTSPISTLSKNCKKTDRPMLTADFHPCIWGDRFLQHFPDVLKNDVIKQEYDELKEEVRRMFNDINGGDLSEKLHFYDAVQLLGVDYHFEKELADALETVSKNASIHNCDLYTVALWFRLLRQQGINVATDVFNKFMDDKGTFKVELVKDVPGMLNLYEAAHLSLPGEHVLDEAMTFTISNLESAISTEALTPRVREQIARALNRPIRKNFPRLEARHHISLCSNDDGFVSAYKHKALIRFAKLDFNVLQALHQKELASITEWWKKLDFATKLPFARDRLVECYFWFVGVYFEPKYSLARIFTTKVLKMTSVMDDIFDNYGTYDELKVLTDCIERWDISVIDQLPEYMKCFYRALLDMYNEMEEEVAKQGRSFGISYAKEAFKQLVKAYLVEAKWREESHIPPLEEYMKNALVSSTYPMLTTNSYVGMEIASKEAFDWISNNPNMLVSCSIVCRVMDDIITHEFERERDHVYSAVESYMKEHGVSREEAVKYFRKEISNAWKIINESCIKQTTIPMPLRRNILNLTRAIDVVYKDADAYSNSHLLKDLIASLLVEPFPL